MTSFILLADGTSKLLLSDGSSKLILVGHIAEVIEETPVIAKRKKILFNKKYTEPIYTVNVIVITFRIPVFWTNESKVKLEIPLYKISIQEKRIIIYDESNNIISLPVLTYNRIGMRISTALESIRDISLKTDFKAERLKGLVKLRRLIKYGQL